MTVETPNKMSLKRWRLQESLNGVAVMLASRLMRWTILFLGLGLTVLAIWENAWQPLTEPVSLPAGVTAQNPAVDANVLKSINDQRLRRVDSLPSSFQTAGIIVPAPLRP